MVYGLSVTPNRLSRIERAESVLRARLGPLANIRVRDLGQAARIEVDLTHIPAVTALLGDITAALQQLGWDAVTVDPAGFRSGSLNATH